MRSQLTNNSGSTDNAFVMGEEEMTGSHQNNFIQNQDSLQFLQVCLAI